MGRRYPSDPACANHCLAWSMFEDCREADSSTMQHIESCDTCTRWLEDARLRLAAHEEQSTQPLEGTRVHEIGLELKRELAIERRRRFLKVGVLAGALLGAGGGIRAWIGSSNSGQPPVSPIETHRKSQFTQFEGLFHNGGLPALSNVVTSGTQKQIRWMFKWIAQEEVAAAYPILLAALADPRKEVRKEAAGRLGRIPPASLKSDLSQIRLAASNESDPAVRQLLEFVASRIDKS